MRPSFACVLRFSTHFLNAFAGATCTSSSNRNPHSRLCKNSINCLEEWDRVPVYATMLYTEITIPAAPSLAPANCSEKGALVTSQCGEGKTYRLGRLRRKDGYLLVTDVCELDELLLPLLGRYSVRHASCVSYAKGIRLHRTWTHAEVQSTSTLFLMVHAAVMPTRVLPAPQGNTMIPDLARLHNPRRPSDRPSTFPTARTDPFPNILLNDVS